MAQHYPEFFYVSTKDNFYLCGLKLLSATVYQRAPSGSFLGGGQQSSHGTGGRAWAKITNAKGGVIEKV